MQRSEKFKKVIARLANAKIIMKSRQYVLLWDEDLKEYVHVYSSGKVFIEDPRKIAESESEYIESLIS